MLHRICVKDSACSIPGQMGRQHSAVAEAWKLESREPTCSPGIVTNLSPYLFELQALCIMRLLNLRVALDTSDSDVQVLHSVGVWKQWIPPEFLRSREKWRTVKEGAAGLWEPAYYCRQRSWFLTNFPCTCILIIYLLDKNATKLGGLKQ